MIVTPDARRARWLLSRASLMGHMGEEARSARLSSLLISAHPSPSLVDPLRFDTRLTSFLFRHCAQPNRMQIPVSSRSDPGQGRTTSARAARPPSFPSEVSPPQPQTHAQASCIPLQNLSGFEWIWPSRRLLVERRGRVLHRPYRVVCGAEAEENGEAGRGRPPRSAGGRAEANRVGSTQQAEQLLLQERNW